MEKKKRKSKSILLDVLVTVICLSAFAISLRYFFIELNRNTVRSDITSIGQLQYKYKVAQRKFEDRVVWERLQLNSTLYNGDIIRTSSQAAATIAFNNNSSLELGENTMLQIFITDDGDFVISLDSGTIAVDSENVENNSQVSLQMKNGSEVILKAGSSFSAATDDTGVTSFTIKQGDVTVTDDAGIEFKMSQGESYTQTKEGKLSQKAISASSPGNILNFDEKPVDVKIDWNVIDEYKNDKLIIETSKTPDFSKIENTYTKKSDDKFSIPMEEGKLYWRIYPESDVENKTSGDFKVIKIPGIQLLSPVNNTDLKLKDKLSLNFAWSRGEQVSYYKFQLAKDSSFTSVIKEEKVFDEKFNFELKDENQSEQNVTYFWRVIPYYAVGNQGYKESGNYNSFKVLKESNAEIIRPELLYPTDSLIVYSKDQDSQLTFMWDCEKPLEKYRLQVSKSRDFSNCIVDTETKNTVNVQQINSQKYQDGTYYWKVTGYSSGLQQANESLTKTFEVKKENIESIVLVLPEDKTETEKKSAIEIAMEKAGVPLESTIEKNNNLIEEIVKNNDSTPETPVATTPAEPVKQETVVVKAPEPEVVKPVKVEQPKPVVKTEPVNKPVSTPVVEEPVVETKVVEIPVLADPVLMEPAAGTKIDTDYIRTNRKVVFNWQSVADATDYTFDLYQVMANGGKKRVFQQKEIKTNSFEFEELSKLQNGNFEWRVTAYKHTGLSETTIHSKQISQIFSIEIGLPSKVNTITPGEQYGE